MPPRTLGKSVIVSRQNGVKLAVGQHLLDLAFTATKQVQNLTVNHDDIIEKYIAKNIMQSLMT